MPENDALAILSKLLFNLGSRSKLALVQAAQAADTPGCDATLVISITRDPKAPNECVYSTAPSSLVSELWRGGK